tara:strand:- start:83 stop:553 length:471 start_codon:yes stop_codon:yes gene_type:complete
MEISHCIAYDDGRPYEKIDMNEIIEKYPEFYTDNHVKAAKVYPKNSSGSFVPQNSPEHNLSPTALPSIGYPPVPPSAKDEIKVVLSQLSEVSDELDKLIQINTKKPVKSNSVRPRCCSPLPVRRDTLDDLIEIRPKRPQNFDINNKLPTIAGKSKI